MIFVRFSFYKFLVFSVLFSYMFVSDKKTYPNRGKFGVLGSFFDRGEGGYTHSGLYGANVPFRKIKKSEVEKNKNFKKRKKSVY